MTNRVSRWGPVLPRPDIAGTPPGIPVIWPHRVTDRRTAAHDGA